MRIMSDLINFFKKPFFVQIILLIALMGIIYFLKLSFDLSDSNTPNLATLVINFETEKRFFEGEVVKEMTMLDALSAAVSVGKIKLNYAIDESGNVNIKEIDGHTNGVNDKHFVFYLNSKKINMPDLNTSIVHGGDKIEIGFK